MSMVDYTKFALSLKRLEEQYRKHHSMDEKFPEWIQDGIAESVIQRFETCYDCLWKVLKRYLKNDLGVDQIPNSPKPVLRLANENNLISSPVEHWFEYVDARVGTSHDYDGEKAKECIALIEYFIGDAIDLYETMSGEAWE